MGTIGSRVRSDEEIQAHFVEMTFRNYDRLIQQAYALTEESESGTLNAPFVNPDGTISHPILTDILPVGAEDIHHPDTREFIAVQWKTFIDQFEELDEAGRVAHLQNLLGEWERLYLTRWDTANMSGMMLDIRELAARSALTAYLKQNPVNYDMLLRYGNDIGGMQGEVSPALAYAAHQVAGLHPEDTVRVDDAGDGLIATFLEAEATYSDSNPLRRAVFNQLMPGTEIDALPIAPADVLFTSNSENLSPSEILRGVNPSGRAVIYGDKDWHRISGHVIGVLKNFDTVESYLLSSEIKNLDEASQALHAQLFVAWKNLNKQIKGALDFNGQLSAYESENGVVIVIDNIEGTETKYENFNIGNTQGIDVARIQGEFQIVAGTRKAPRREAALQARRAAELTRRSEEAKARARAAINYTANRDRTRIFANNPDIEIRVKSLTERVQRENLIPKGTQFNSVEELAVIADMARNPSMATTQVLLVQDGTVTGSVLGAVRSGEDVRAHPDDIEAMMPSTEAEGHDVIVVVNRPSGDTSISENDKRHAEAISGKYSGFKYYAHQKWGYL